MRALTVGKCTLEARLLGSLVSGGVLWRHWVRLHDQLAHMLLLMVVLRRLHLLQMCLRLLWLKPLVLRLC